MRQYFIISRQWANNSGIFRRFGYPWSVQEGKVAAKEKYLREWIETNISAIRYRKPLLWKSLGIFDFSVLHSCRWYLQVAALKMRFCCQVMHGRFPCPDAHIVLAPKNLKNMNMRARVFETSVFAVHTIDLRFKSLLFQKRVWKPVYYGNSVLNIRRDNVRNSV